MKKSPQTVLLLIAAALVLPACAAPAGEPPEPSSEAPDPSARTTRPPFETTPPRETDGGTDGDGGGSPAVIPDDVWAAILDDVSNRVGERVPDPTVVKAEAVTWNSGALGCPQPGQMYTQALVDGYQVVIEVDGTTYDYRVGGGTTVRLCEGEFRQGG